MTLRKTTIDNSLKYIPQSEQTQERESEPKTIRKTSHPKKKQNRNISENNKNFINDYITGEGFRIFTRIMNCYF